MKWGPEAISDNSPKVLTFGCLIVLCHLSFFRCHIVGQFNRGLYEVIVASDEKFLDEDQQHVSESSKQKRVDKDKERSKLDKDNESGVARGIDFQFVSNIINFDFPLDTDSYIHRYNANILIYVIILPVQLPCHEPINI